MPGIDPKVRFLVVGTGRCGTGYVAGILTACGLPTGHESIFGPHGPGPVPPHMIGDSSWLAVPYVEPGAGVRIIHLVRDPIHVVRSLVGIKFFSNPVHGAWRKFAFRYVPELPADDDLAAAILWTVDWNRRCEKLVDDEKSRVRLEDLTTVEAVQRLVELAGGEVSPVQARRALGIVPRNYNARSRFELDWSDIPDDEPGKRLRTLAAQYGYSAS